MKRFFDFIFAFTGALLLLPFMAVITICIVITSKGSPFYKQVRVGRNNINFSLLKFRTMYLDSDKGGLLTIGNRDPRVTGIGIYLRKYKLDELPQLVNVLLGDMSLVGPRPEVRRYVDLYNAEQLKVLRLRPGITDMASIKYRNENDILEKHSNPEAAYIKIIMPDKLAINLKYIKQTSSVTGSLRIIILTFLAIIKK